MKRMIKLIMKILLCLIGSIFLFIICIAIYHHIMLSIENRDITPNGTMVLVDGFHMHIYAEGEKNNRPTLIIMSGAGVAAPVYDYKALYSLLSDEYRIVVIEKFGYGYSDVSGMSRDVAIMVNQNREALSLAGEKAPYILLPHSMSALEAIHWSVNFPNEISAIIGLDMAVPETYAPYTNEYSQMNFLKFITWLGLHRIPFINPISQRGLSTDEIKQHKYLAYKVTLNNDIIAENTRINENAEKVHELGVPEIPMLLFMSSSEEQWIEGSDESQRNFAGSSEKTELIQLDCGHNVHYYESEFIANQIKRFISNLQK